MEHWTAAADFAQSVSTQARGLRLANCVGIEPADQVATHAEEVCQLLRSLPASASDSNSKVASTCQLANEVLRLVDIVDLDFVAKMSICFDEGALLIWGFSVELAETICLVLAALVCAVEAQRAWTSSHMELSSDMEQIGFGLDGIALHMYGALCRLGFGRTNGLQDGEIRLVLAFQGIATWSLALLCSFASTRRLTSEMLWEWASGDPLWAFALVKGIMTFDAEAASYAGLPIPSNLFELKAAAIEAALGCASPNIAFREELDADLIADDIDGGFSMLQRCIGLSQHRARVAVAVIDCSLLDVFVKEARSSDNLAWLPAFANFLCALLQPPPEGEDTWAAVTAFELEQGLESAYTMDDVKGVVDALVAEVSAYISTIWELMTVIPLTSAHLGGGIGFLRNCASLASVFPLSLEGCAKFVESCLMGKSQTDVNAKPLAMLCMFVANCGYQPADIHGLQFILASMTDEQKEETLQHLCRTRVPVRNLELMAVWKETICPQTSLSSILPSVVRADPSDQQICSTNFERCAGQPGLRALLHGAPQDLACSLDGRLLVDPVRSPYGHAFERSNLACALSISPGRCPITGQPLEMQDCQRDVGLRQQAALWLRKMKTMQRRKEMTRPPPLS